MEGGKSSVRDREIYLIIQLEEVQSGLRKAYTTQVFTRSQINWEYIETG